MFVRKMSVKHFRGKKVVINHLMSLENVFLNGSISVSRTEIEINISLDRRQNSLQEASE